MTAKTGSGSMAFRVGSWLLGLTGVAHLMAFLAERSAPPEGAMAEAWTAMAAADAFSPGVPHTLADFHLGNSLGMGIMYVAFGALALLVERTLRAAGVAMPRAIVAAVWLATAASIGVAVAFFPAPPTVFFVGALVAYSLALRPPAARA